MMIEFTSFDFLIGIAILAILLVILWRQKKSFSYLFFFSIFWIYLLYVVSVVVFPFPIIEISAGEIFKPSINLIPLYFGLCSELPNACFMNIVGNILITMPFGFGVSFIARVRAKDFLWLAFVVGFTFEGAQIIISLIFRSPFRSIDINDVILNAIGVLLGYGCFRIFAWLYLMMAQRLKINLGGIFAYVHNVANQA
jgi:glycopeptide antibiotics resistance protein